MANKFSHVRTPINCTPTHTGRT